MLRAAVLSLHVVLAMAALHTKRGVVLDGADTYEVAVPVPLHPTTYEPHSRFSTRGLKVDRYGHPLHEKNIAYKVHAFGKELVLNLQLNSDLISPQYQHVYVGDHGAHHMRRGLENCHYQGNVNDDSETIAAISTCNGLNGFIHLRTGERYTIHPLTDELDELDKVNHHRLHRRHAVVKHDDKDSTNNRDEERTPCALNARQVNEDDIDTLEDKIRDIMNNGRQEASTTNSDTNSIKSTIMGNKTVELMLASDYSRYKVWGNDSETTLVEMANFVNTLYERGNILEGSAVIKVSLAGVITATKPMWVPEEPTDVDVDLLLGSWCNWRTENLADPANSDNFLGNNDAGHLLTTRRMTTTAMTIPKTASIEGYAHLGGICNTKRSCGVERGIKTPRLSTQAMVIAHELGHNLGAKHDGDRGQCADRGYIMEKSSCKECGMVSRQWSNCSKANIQTLFENADVTCLDNSAVLCGNGVIDIGEECDSGDRVNGSSCCTSTCKLRPTAQCDDRNGPCCNNCTLASPTKICRGSTTTGESSTCDPIDYCTGKSPTCPKLMKNNGAVCSISPVDGYSFHNGTCNNGVCQSREQMCVSHGYEHSSECDWGREQPCVLYCKKPTGGCIRLAYGSNTQLSFVAPNFSPCTELSGLSGTCNSGRCIVNGTEAIYEPMLLDTDTTTIKSNALPMLTQYMTLLLIFGFSLGFMLL